MEEMIVKSVIDEEINGLADKGDGIDFKITDKVANLMMRIAENNYASRDEIGVLFTSYGYRFRLIKGLKSLGMINELKTHVIPSKVYFLTPLGYEYLESLGMLRVQDRFNPSNFRIATCFHTLAGLGVRLIFEKHNLVSEWKPERVLNFSIRKESRMVDAEFNFCGIHCGVEVELTLKAPRVIEENLKKLKGRDELKNIFWVIRNRNVFESMRNVYGFSPNQTAILNDDQEHHLFIMLEDLQKNRLDANVFNLNEKKIKFRDLEFK